MGSEASTRMSVPPRAVFLTLVITVALLPAAGADGTEECIDAILGYHADGLGFSLDPMGQTIMFLAESGMPGEGVVVGFVVHPPSCVGIPGVGIIPGDDHSPDPMATAGNARSLIPLP